MPSPRRISGGNWTFCPFNPVRLCVRASVRLSLYELGYVALPKAHSTRCGLESAATLEDAQYGFGAQDLELGHQVLVGKEFVQRHIKQAGHALVGGWSC